MSEIAWEVVYETSGSFLAEILRGLLEAQEIPVLISQEGAGRIYGVTVGTLGRTQILVPSQYLERAQEILAEYEANNLPEMESPGADVSGEPDTDEEDQPGEDERDQ